MWLYMVLYMFFNAFNMVYIYMRMYVYIFIFVYLFIYSYLFICLFIYLYGFYMLSSKSCSLIWFRMCKLWENLSISEGQVVTNPCCASRDRSPSGYLLLCFIVCSFVSAGLGSTYTIPFGPIL